MTDAQIITYTTIFTCAFISGAFMLAAIQLALKVIAASPKITNWIYRDKGSETKPVKERGDAIVSASSNDAIGVLTEEEVDADELYHDARKRGQLEYREEDDDGDPRDT